MTAALRWLWRRLWPLAVGPERLYFSTTFRLISGKRVTSVPIRELVECGVEHLDLHVEQIGGEWFGRFDLMRGRRS